jgi:hypothetical protein
MSHLVPCLSCHRHVRASDELCPFCGVALSSAQRDSDAPELPRRRLGRAALFTFGATLIGGAACSDGTGGSKDAAGDTSAVDGGGSGGGGGGGSGGGGSGGGGSGNGGSGSGGVGSGGRGGNGTGGTASGGQAGGGGRGGHAAGGSGGQAGNGGRGGTGGSIAPPYGIGPLYGAPAYGAPANDE